MELWVAAVVLQMQRGSRLCFVIREAALPRFPPQRLGAHVQVRTNPVSYTHLRAHETLMNL
eukprot:5136309-Prymnesium_polylepis.3